MIANLRLRRLSIHRSGHTLFDERFHDGVNILHGDNGSGKSTIADFIFFALGGDLTSWKAHAELAEFTLAEIQTCEAMLTVRRDVSSITGRPMHVFFGPYEDAVVSGPAAWQVFPYKRPDSGLSFSQVLFRAMGIPEAISSGSSNITMHQMLRLIYGDQLTPIQRIFREENFDTWETRQAVGDLLCGVGGYDLYDRQLDLRLAKRSFDEISSQLRNLMTVAASFGREILIENIHTGISELTKKRESLLKDIGETRDDQSDEEEQSAAEKSRRAAGREFVLAKQSVGSLEDRAKTLEFEIQDAKMFIQHLEQTLTEFSDATKTFFALGQVRFEFCPSCFAPTHDGDIDEARCHLCGTSLAEGKRDSKTLAIHLDIEMQLKESRELLDDRERSLNQLGASLRLERSRLRRAAGAVELSRRSTFTAREEFLAQKSRQIGFLDSEIEVMQKRLQLAEEIDQLSSKKEALNSRISSLQESIAAIIRGQERRKAQAYTAVSETTRKLLERDLAEHNDFGQIEHVTFSFAEDWIAINQDKNRSRSASGMVILKNSFLAALFLSSVGDPLFALPRFMLLDNIEDKGMVQERSWNFQRIIVEEANQRNNQGQIIFTTSKIAPEFAGSEYVVGRKFTRERPSLDFAPNDRQAQAVRS